MLSEKPDHSIVSSMEGTRPILVEVQALVCRSNLAMPRRIRIPSRASDGCDEKRIGMHLSTCDAYVNIDGGIRCQVSTWRFFIDSSYKDIAIDEKHWHSRSGLWRSSAWQKEWQRQKNWALRRSFCRQNGKSRNPPAHGKFKKH